VRRRASTPPRIANQDGLTTRYNDLSRQLETLRDQTKPISTELKDRAKLRKRREALKRM
jgi:hypothetical protein